MRIFTFSLGMGACACLGVANVCLGDGNGATVDPCEADLTGDGIVNGADLGQLLLQFGSACPCAADFNGNGVVNGFDLGQLLLNWEKPCVVSNCCVASGGLGCECPSCEDAVCAVDPFCCNVAWDALCANEAADFCGDLCSGGKCAALSDCCEANGGVGCDCQTCENAVCAVDGFCCFIEWDSLCADQAVDLCGDLCSGGKCAALSDCCKANGGVGCDCQTCENAVCAVDGFCCFIEWDSLCADQAADLCGSLCFGEKCPDAVCEAATNNCCTPVPAGSGITGCNQPACCESICALDPFCCLVEWDRACVASVLNHPACDCITFFCESATTNCCTLSGGTPGCNQPACCASVCEADPFCCLVEWDSACVVSALNNPACDCITFFCESATTNCCAPSGGTPGCNQPACCESVCEADPFCCLVEWDDLCAEEALKSPACDCTTVCDTATNDCCTAGGGPGCNQPACCASVCAVDPFCCDVAWDSICANEAAKLCGGVCGPCNCCTGGDSVGCNNAACEAAVCGIDPFCCNVDWDSICNGEALDLCTCCGSSNCCSAHGGLGCDNPACASTVCDVDPFCCNVAWDSICAGEAADLCGGLCG